MGYKIQAAGSDGINPVNLTVMTRLLEDAYGLYTQSLFVKEIVP